MKRILIGTVLAAASMNVFAVAPGGPGCGWGNMLFEGQSGLPSHLIASITNGTSGNATFGMTSGTNGCDTSGRLAYNGKPMLVLSSIMSELSEDVARGEGEALTTYAVVKCCKWLRFFSAQAKLLVSDPVKGLALFRVRKKPPHVATFA